ncbi:hypothetical protein [Nonomuraea rubra]
MESARHAFTGSMQVTSLIAAALLLVASGVAWRLIPSTREKEAQHDGHH